MDPETGNPPIQREKESPQSAQPAERRFSISKVPSALKKWLDAKRSPANKTEASSQIVLPARESDTDTPGLSSDQVTQESEAPQAPPPAIPNTTDAQEIERRVQLRLEVD